MGRSSTPRPIIVGAGIAGLYTALKAAPQPVMLLCPRIDADCSSKRAQGGMAAAIGETDCADDHRIDTLRAGAGLVDPEVAHLVTREAAEIIADMLRLGVPFDRGLEGELLLAHEAAHMRPRALRAGGDRIGEALVDALSAHVRRAAHIEVLEGLLVEDLLLADGRVCGLLACDIHSGERRRIAAPTVVFATGGCGGLFERTTNPSAAQGHGLAMAARAGATLSGLEFIQFHPTALDIDAHPVPLISEAVRGEGAYLVNDDGERFMLELHPQAELAPRDVVARGVAHQHKRGQRTFLDATQCVAGPFAERFPSVAAFCREAGIDPDREGIPVAPAAHYQMGGIATDAVGQSSVPGLMAVGEVAATGLHGANRLAGNSLLESLVFGARAGKHLAASTELPRQTVRLPKSELAGLQPGPATRIDALRAMMAAHCGVVRSGPGLADALAGLDELAKAAVTTGDFNSIAAARLIVAAARDRAFSVGAHYRSDGRILGVV